MDTLVRAFWDLARTIASWLTPPPASTSTEQSDWDWDMVPEARAPTPRALFPMLDP